MILLIAITPLSILGGSSHFLTRSPPFGFPEWIALILAGGQYRAAAAAYVAA
jgi:hypothetical protein